MGLFAVPPKFRARAQPIRDAILVFLSSEVRCVAAIAAHIDRSSSVATGHLAAMRRRGLVVRIGYAAYARVGYKGPPVEFIRGPGTGMAATIRQERAPGTQTG